MRTSENLKSNTLKFTGQKFEGEEFTDDNGMDYGLNVYDFQARTYDPQIGRWWQVDPLAHAQLDKTPYHFVSNNPINRIDPTGMLDEWVEKEGQMMYDNRVTNQEDATALYGKGATYRPNGYTYTASNGASIELGDYGFFKSNGQINSSPDLAQNSLAFTNPSLAMAIAQNSVSAMQASYAIPLTIRTGQTADLLTLDPSDALPLKWAGHAVLFLGTAYYITKMEKEIEGIKRRAGGPQGVQYSLRATSAGPYICYTCVSGTMNLSLGDVWKYGETINPATRYSDSYLQSVGGVKMFPEFYGNQVQIKVMEKNKIYDYFLQNGHLPPGNKIFR